jgi:hypothetical protein
MQKDFSASICMCVCFFVLFYGVVLTVPFITLFKIFCHQFIFDVCVCLEIYTHTHTLESASRSLYSSIYQVSSRLVTLNSFISLYKLLMFLFLLCVAS